MGAGSIGALSTLGTVSVNAKSPESLKEFKQAIEKSRKIQEKHGVKSRKEFLNERGMRITLDEARGISYKEREKFGSNQISTNSLDCIEPDKCNGQISLELSLINSSKMPSLHYVELGMEFKYKRYYNEMFGEWINEPMPEPPVDGAGIAWRQDHWEILDQSDIPSSVATGNNVEWDNGSWDQEGVGFRVNSNKQCMDSGITEPAPAWDRGFSNRDGRLRPKEPEVGTIEWSDRTYASAYVKPGEDFESGSAIQASYSYAFKKLGDPKIGVSVSYPPGVSVTPTSKIKQEDLQTDLDENTLLVTRSEPLT